VNGWGWWVISMTALAVAAWTWWGILALIDLVI
jgi:hypothetical protein